MNFISGNTTSASAASLESMAVPWAQCLMLGAGTEWTESVLTQTRCLSAGTTTGTRTLIPESSPTRDLTPEIG